MMGVEGAKVKIVIDYLIPKFFEADQLKTSLILRLLFPSHNVNSHLDLLPLYIVLALGGGLYTMGVKQAGRKKVDKPFVMIFNTRLCI